MKKNRLEVSQKQYQAYSFYNGFRLGIFACIIFSFVYYQNYQILNWQKMISLYAIANILFMNSSKLWGLYKDKKTKAKIGIFLLYMLDLAVIVYVVIKVDSPLNFDNLSWLTRYFLPLGALLTGMLVRLLINYIMLRHVKIEQKHE